MHNCCFIEDHAHALPTLQAGDRLDVWFPQALSCVFELFEKEVRMRARMEAELDVLRRLWRSPVSSRGEWLGCVCCFKVRDGVHPLFLFRGCATRSKMVDPLRKTVLDTNRNCIGSSVLFWVRGCTVRAGFPLG